MKLNRAEALNELKKLPKAQLFKVLVKLTESYQEYVAQYKVSYAEFWHLTHQVQYYKGKYEAIRDRVEPTKLKFEPYIDYEAIVRQSVESLRTPITNTIVRVPPKKTYLLGRLVAWSKEKLHV